MQFSHYASGSSPSRTLFPVEIIERILSEAWSLTLRPPERNTLFTSLCLVNRAWLDLFIRIALTDVHITGEAYAHHYLRLLRTRVACESNSDFLLPNASETANTLCRSLTFHVDARHKCPETSSKFAIKLYSAGDSAAGAISSTLYMLNLMHSCVPNLRRVSIEYIDWGFDDIFDQYRLMPMPKQVTDLQVRFSYSPALARSPNALKELRRRYELTPHPFGRFAVPNVRTLSVLGSSTSFAAGMLEACPQAHTLTIDEHVELPVVPPWVRTVVLQDSKSRADRLDVRSDDWVVAARSVCGGVKETCTPHMMALLCPVAGQDYQRARKRLRTFCRNNQVRVVET